MAVSTITSRSTAAVACAVAVLALLSTRGATTQSASGANQQIAVLQQQLSALDRRVKDLEQAATAAAAADQVKPEPANGGKPDATVETRIAQLEAEVRSLQSQEATGGGGESQSTKTPGAGRPAGLVVKAPFRVVDASGKLLMDVDVGKDNTPRLQVGNSQTGAVMLGAPNGSGAVVVYRTGGQMAAGLGSNKGGMGVHIFSDDGEAIEASLTLNEEKHGELQVGHAEEGSVKLGVGPSGAGFVSVRTTAGKTGVGLGVFQNAPMGVYVLNPDGQQIEASMTTSKDGGSFQLNTSGKQAVHMDRSSLVFYSDGGNPLSLFGTKERGKGYMELNDSTGTKMVEAGMLNSKVGYVLATPYRSSVGANGNPSVLMGGAGR